MNKLYGFIFIPGLISMLLFPHNSEAGTFEKVSAALKNGTYTLPHTGLMVIAQGSVQR